jgi:hypothetical protein
MTQKHPYKTFKVVPDIPSDFIERPLEEIRASIKKNLAKVSARNKAMIPPEIYEQLKKAHAGRKKTIQ